MKSLRISPRLIGLLIVLIVALTILASLGYGSKIWRSMISNPNDDSDTPTYVDATSSASLDMSEWKTYSNEKFGFYIKYPPFLNSIDKDFEMSFKDTTSEYSDEQTPPVFFGELGSDPYFPGLVNIEIRSKSTEFIPYTDLKTHIVDKIGMTEGRGSDPEEIGGRLRLIEVSGMKGYYTVSGENFPIYKTAYFEKGPYIYYIDYIYAEPIASSSPLRPDIMSEVTPQIFTSFEFIN